MDDSRKPRTRTAKKAVVETRGTTKKDTLTPPKSQKDQVAPGMMSVPIPSIKDPDRVMLVPNDLDEDDCEMIGQMLGAIAKRLQKVRTD
jgi:hypothetical protein